MPPENEQDRHLPGTRKKLQRCQHGVYHPTKGADECGEPAVATWDWGNGLLYVCDEHDRVVEEHEQEAEEQRKQG